jgi:hypothetical protein
MDVEHSTENLSKVETILLISISRNRTHKTSQYSRKIKYFRENGGFFPNLVFMARLIVIIVHIFGGGKGVGIEMTYCCSRSVTNTKYLANMDYKKKIT